VFLAGKLTKKLAENLDAGRHGDGAACIRLLIHPVRDDGSFALIKSICAATITK
jgi:hypothetical protein